VTPGMKLVLEVPAYDPSSRHPRWLGAIRIDVGWPQARVVIDSIRDDAVYTGDDGYAYPARWVGTPVAAYTTTSLHVDCSPNRSTP
jgi:hypothetical protein